LLHKRSFNRDFNAEFYEHQIERRNNEHGKGIRVIVSTKVIPVVVTRVDTVGDVVMERVPNEDQKQAIVSAKSHIFIHCATPFTECDCV